MANSTIKVVLLAEGMGTKILEKLSFGQNCLLNSEAFPYFDTL